MHYRSLPRISNSDLTEFRKIVLPQRGDGQPLPTKAFSFGAALHELVLEPHVIKALPDVDLQLCMMLARRVRADPFCAWVLQFSAKEQIQLWQDETTGLALKSKLDIVHRSRLVVDIKTTSQRNYAAFVRSCYHYDYDRQAAFYMDSVGANGTATRRFRFVAVQKVKPFDIWHYEATPDFIASGRKKYTALLREWKRRAEQGNPFTPTSWRSAAQNYEPVTD
jgi:hypothetical protein